MEDVLLDFIGACLEFYADTVGAACKFILDCILGVFLFTAYLADTFAKICGFKKD